MFDKILLLLDLIFYGFFLITISIFVTQVLSFYQVRLFENNSTEVIIALVIIVVYGIKFVVINLVGYIFQVQKEAKDYMMSVFLFCNTLGLFMLPLVICLSFVKQLSPAIFIYIGVVIIASFLCIRMVRGIFIGLKSQRVSKFYLFQGYKDT